MADILIAAIKRNTPDVATGKVGLRNSQFCDYFRISEKDAGEIVSRNAFSKAREAYLYVKFPLSKEAWLRTQIAPVYDVLQPEKEISRSDGWVEFKRVATALGISDADIKANKKLPVQDGSKLNTSDPLTFKTVKHDGLPPKSVAVDKAAITAGNATFGGGVTASPHYATYLELQADTANLTGNLTATEVDNHTEVGQPVHTISLGGFDYTVTSDTPTLGNPNTGHLWTVAHNAYAFENQMEGPGNFYLNSIHMKRTVAAAAARAFYRENGVAVGFTSYVSDLLLDGNNLEQYGIDLKDAQPIANVWNIVMWDVLTNGILNSTSNASTLVENCTLYSNTAQGWLGNVAVDHSARNVVSYANGTDWFRVGASTGTNCAQTGAGAIGFLVEAGTVGNVADGTFQSVVDNNAEFLFHTDGGILDRTGSDPAIALNTAGINGVARDATNVSIGAWERAASGGGSCGAWIHEQWEE